MSKSKILIFLAIAISGALTYWLILPRKVVENQASSDLISYTPVKAEAIEQLIAKNYPNQYTIKNKSDFKITLQTIGKNYTYFYNNNERLLEKVIQYKAQENELIAKFEKENGYVLVPNDVLIGLIKLQQAQ
jgi:hypothetical protein